MSLRSSLARWYRSLLPFRSFPEILRTPLLLLRFFRDFFRIRTVKPDGVSFRLWPILDDWIRPTPYDPHYTLMGYWATRRIQENQPQHHYDVSSLLSWVANLSAIVPVTYWEFKPREIPIPDLKCLHADILNLPSPSLSVDSLSCLHVLEHIGLGRYGDPILEDGPQKAMAELSRILAPGGKLYLATPVGKPVLYFNAHRIFAPGEILEMASANGLEMLEFSYINDQGRLLMEKNPEDASEEEYGLGLYLFSKTDTSCNG